MFYLAFMLAGIAIYAQLLATYVLFKRAQRAEGLVKFYEHPTYPNDDADE